MRKLFTGDGIRTTKGPGMQRTTLLALGATGCWFGTAGLLLAQTVPSTPALPGIEVGTVTIGGLVTAMAAGHGYIVKRLFEANDLTQKTFAATLDSSQRSFAMTLEKLIDDRREDREKSAERHDRVMTAIMSLVRTNTKLRAAANAEAANEDTPN